MASESPYRVRAVHCDHRASDEEVYQALVRATSPLDRSWAKLKRAGRIMIKFNQAFLPENLRYHEGQLQDLVDPSVARATLRLLRKETDAELCCTEISVYAGRDRDCPAIETITLLDLLREFDVTFVDGNEPPNKVCRVPGGGLMFQQYLLPEAVADADEFVSVQKMKSHVFMGVTMTLKNLFGLLPIKPPGRARSYFHHLVRLPYILVDLGRMINPALNIVDALIGQTGREWRSAPRVCDALIAGDHTIATDACGTHLMGHDPAGDWPIQPFVRARNALLIAHQNGFGTVDLNEIDFESEVEAPLAAFSTDMTDPPDVVADWRRTTCEQALYYRDHRDKFISRYAGEFILLQQNEVRWHSTDSVFRGSRRDLAGDDKRQAMWFKYVDPDEAEGEHFEVYERTLAQFDK